MVSEISSPNRTLARGDAKGLVLFFYSEDKRRRPNFHLVKKIQRIGNLLISLIQQSHLSHSEVRDGQQLMTDTTKGST